MGPVSVFDAVKAGQIGGSFCCGQDVIGGDYIVEELEVDGFYGVAVIAQAVQAVQEGGSDLRIEAGVIEGLLEIGYPVFLGGLVRKTLARAGQGVFVWII